MQLISVKLNKLVYEVGLPPMKSFVDSVREHGLKKPIWVERTHHDPSFYCVLDGRRRAQAVEQIGETDEIPAMLVEDGDGPMFTLISQFHRSANPIAEARALLALREKYGWDEKETATKLCMSVSWVWGRLQMIAGLDKRLVAKVEDGTMPVSAANRAAKLDQKAQAALVERERVTIKDVEGMRRAQRLELLNLDTIEVPCGPSYAMLAAQLQVVANSFNGNERKAILEVARILEGRGKDD